MYEVFCVSSTGVVIYCQF